MSDPKGGGKPRIYTSALFCQDIINELKTNALTAVRIGDSFAPRQIHPPSSRPFYPVFTIRALFIFRTDSPTPVKFDLAIKGVAPDGEKFDVAKSMSTDIESSARGRTFSIDMNLPSENAGLFWFEVYVDRELSTRLSLEVLHNTPSQQGNSPAESQTPGL